MGGARREERGSSLIGRGAPRWRGAWALMVVVSAGCLGELPPLPQVPEATGDTGGSGTGPGVTSTTGVVDDSGSGDGSDSSGTGPDFDPVCGDGLIEGDEECDLGMSNGTGDYCTSDCSNNVCGDGYLGPGEACDDGDQNNDDMCTNQCGLPTCGDGVIQLPEECDDGAANSQTGSCLPSCIQASCGDLFINQGVEACDGVNTGASDCISEGFADGGVLECQNDCMGFDTSNCHECGNGDVEPTELCDGAEFEMSITCADFAPGGTTVSGGSLLCSASCMEIDASACTFCGDGSQEGAEICDGVDLGGQTCASRLGPGFGGLLTCSADCSSLDTSNCCLVDGEPCVADSECCSNNCQGGMMFCAP